LRTVRQSQLIHSLQRTSRVRIWLLLIVLSTSGAWQSSVSIARGQSTGVRFTQSLKFQEINPGVEYGQTVSGEASKDELTGPWLINVIRVDLTRAKLKVVHAMDEGVGLETVSSLAARYGAVAATNGGYFRVGGTYRGDSIGLLFLDGALISEPYNERADFGLIEDGNKTNLVFGHLKFSGKISFGSKTHVVNGLNRPLLADELIIFTSKFHRTTLTNPDGLEVVVRSGRVISIGDLKGSSSIPADGYVISAVGKARGWLKNNLRKGSRITFSWQLSSIEPADTTDWLRASSLLGGGPQLIRAGKVAITDKQEKMSAGFATDRHPRTAIAKLESGKVLLVTVDGRQPGVSVGMSLYMLAELLLELETVEAMNLDGGGSTTMIVHNKIVNKPSDQTGERPVSDAILIFPKPN
jgi:exopolysaccharide biosynthesis protein